MYRCFIFIITVILFTSCRSTYLHVPPVLEENETSAFTYELKYITETDQTDRKKGFFHLMFNTKKGKLIHERDSIRTQRVYEIYQDERPKNDDDKFMMGLLFMHSSKKEHHQLAYELFCDLEKNGATENDRRNGAEWKEVIVKHRNVDE